MGALVGTAAAVAIIIAVAAWFGPRCLACTIVGVALGIRFDLFATGSLYSPTDVWAADIITAALVFLSMILFLAQPGSPANQTGMSWERRLTTVGIAIAVPVGLVGAVQLAAPSTPHSATAPACAGASVAGGTFLATTPSTGINARSGPDTSYPQVGRFAANCTLSFDGYCIGEPTDDLLISKDPDQRWLILHRAWQTWPWDHMPWGHSPYAFVAAGKVQSQSSESVLGSRPDPICSRLGGWQPPQHIALATTLTNGVVTVKADAVGAELIGVSLMSSRPPANGTGSIFYLTDPAPKRTDRSGAITATWNATSATGQAIGHYPATFTVVAAVCIGPAVPYHNDYADRQYSWNGEILSPTTSSSLSSGIAERLQEEACRIAPDYPKKEP